MKPTDAALPNGPGAAAVLAAGVGALALGLLTLAGDKYPAAKAHLVWYRPTGALSGVTTLSLVLWIGAWAVLGALWRRRDVALRPVLAVSFALLAVGLLLTFPPVIDLF